jgi:anti-sigma regulatory factor (Ser/Thr protein kinase)
MWSCETEDPIDALAEKPSFLSTVRAHAGWELDVPAAEAIFTELLANVVLHAPGPVKVALECDGQAVYIKVADTGPGFVAAAPRLPVNSLSEGQRGLFIVSQLGTDLRVARNGGASVTVRLPSKPTALPQADTSVRLAQNCDPGER